MDGLMFPLAEDSLDSALKAILDQSLDCIKIISVDGSLCFMNRNGQRAMGIDDFDAFAGSAWDSLWPSEGRAQILEAVARAKNGEQSRFEAFCPTAKGEDRWWDVSVAPVLSSHGVITHIISTSRDITAQRAALEAERIARIEAERAAATQTIVAGETRHRLKNLITVVISISKLVARKSRDVQDFSTRFQTYMMHLGRAQDMLTLAETSACTLPSVVEGTIGIWGDPRVDRGDIPKASISDHTVQILALVLGELQTNAIKYGALSTPDGTLHVSARQQDDNVVINWIEDLGCETRAPILDGGTGLDLIRRMLMIDNETPKVEWTGRGLSVQFSVPIST